MKIELPIRSDGSSGVLSPEVPNVVIIGANGSGKSRFAKRLKNDLGDRVFCVSAIEALYGRNRKGSNSIDDLYDSRNMRSEVTGTEGTAFERLLSMLMHDELINLLNYKLMLREEPQTRLSSTRLDQVIGLWQEVFPGNKVLIEGGKFLFSRGMSPDRYAAPRLSDGERAVLFYAGVLLYAPAKSIILVDSPEMFLHPAVIQSLWNRLELLRLDCRFIYTTHDLEFTSSRFNAQVVWVRDYDASSQVWDYVVLPVNSGLTDDMYRAIVGTRKPLMFIEGDGIHSIDSKLYPLIFRDFSVKSLGSCNKVIEATRTFNDLNSFHHMDSVGIVDRDRRDFKEVEYLRRKRILVPDVAEIENIFLLEDVVRAVAQSRHKSPDRVFAKVKKSVMGQFKHDLKQQALLHTRHRVKQTVEYRIDGRFANIDMLEAHIDALKQEINPRGMYESFCREFHNYIECDDYRSVLRVYNQKSMLPSSNVAALCGLQSKEQYINATLELLRTDSAEADAVRHAVLHCFNLPDDIRSGLA